MKLKIIYALVTVHNVILQDTLESQWPDVIKVFLAHAKSDADIWNPFRG